jgi:hypothetical protein
LPDIVVLPIVGGATETSPMPPLWWTVPAHVHPPSAVAVQVSAE